MYKTTCSSYLVRSYLLLVSAPIQYISSFPFGNLNFHTHVYTNATYSPHDFSKYLLPSLIQMRLYSLDIKQQQSINRDTATQFICMHIQLNDQLYCIQHLKGQSWSQSYGSWNYNYLCNQFLSPLTLRVRTPFMAFIPMNIQ